MSSAWEREEDILAEECNSGQISLDEFNEGMRCMASEQREMAERAADEAYNNVMMGW